jgi:BirA family biotin operon repressor/biotin-[acetyl-CoA-carboxylase] ligase
MTRTPLSKADILLALSANNQNKLADIYLLDSVNSTNDYLWQQLPENTNNVSVCIANSQTAGRGRRGDPWQSPNSGNLYLSLLWRLNSPSDINGISILAGVALIQTLAAYDIHQLQLKWPNDLFYQQQKLGGILVESRIGKQQHIMIGIGINYYLPNTSQQQISQATTSLSLLHEHPPCRNLLAGSLINNLMHALSQFEQDGLAPFSQQWADYDACFQQPITISDGDKHIVATGQGINSDGSFRYQIQDKKEIHSISSSDYSIKLAT